jgi:hypothetical protein
MIFIQGEATEVHGLCHPPLVGMVRAKGHLLVPEKSACKFDIAELSAMTEEHAPLGWPHVAHLNLVDLF